MPELARQQEALVHALVAGGSAPPGFDERRVALTRQALMRKRARAVAAHWPALGATPCYQERFAGWAAGRPPKSSHVEGPAFARSLGGDLPPAARVELVLAGHGCVARDGLSLVVRWPVLGVRRLAFRGRGRAR